jgi:hypothetical protein
MVPRADHLAALSLAKAVKDDVDSKASIIVIMEQQLSRVQDQLKSALADLVPRSEFTAARSKCKFLEALAIKAAADHSKAVHEINERLMESLAANDDLLKSMQVAG